MTEVEDFILGFNGKDKSVLDHLHIFLSAVPGMTCKLRYNIPFYYRKSWVCYLNPLKKGGIELAFTRGNELSNHNGLLDSKGRKQVYSVTYHSLEEIDDNILNEVLQEAIILDDSICYASKRKIKR